MVSFLSKNFAISLLLSIISYQLYNNPNSILNKRLLSKNGWRNKYNVDHNLKSTVFDIRSIDKDGKESFSFTNSSKRLLEHSKLFSKKEIIKVNKQVYVGIGYGLANIIVIEGDSSFIIVDTLESINGALQFRNDFNELYNNNDNNKKNISAIIFTHYHADHTQGTHAFIDDINNPPIIISHALTQQGLYRVNSIQSSIVFTRAARQFGTYIKAYDDLNHGGCNGMHHIDDTNLHRLNDGNYTDDSYSNDNNDNDDNDDNVNKEKLHINSGIGPELLLGDAWDKSFILPTKTINSKYEQVIIDGVILDIYYAPGETDDQIFIYLPQTGTLLPADNIYETFPNLYAIRGSPTRDARKWVESLDMMRYLYKSHASNDNNNNNNVLSHMVPSHTRPVIGFDNIYNILTAYRDGITYIHDQTMRFMNKGLTPTEMINIIKNDMPNRLYKHSWLQEFYGTINWSIRGIFNSYLGWFSGDPADLSPLTKSKIAQNMIEMIQYSLKINNNNSSNVHTIDNVINTMLNMAESKIYNDKHTREDCQWSLDLSSNILHLKDDILLGTEYKNYNNKLSGIYIDLTKEQYEKSKKLRIASLTCMAGYETSANGRNYYLTTAFEDTNDFKIKPTKKAAGTVILSIGIEQLFDAMQVRFKYKESISLGFTNKTLCFIFDITNDKIEIPKHFYNNNNNNNNNDKLYSWYKVEIRDGIVEILKGDDFINKENSKFGFILSKNECFDESSIVVEMKSTIYRELVSKMKRSPAILYTLGEINVVKGAILTFKKFTDLFEKAGDQV